MDYLIVSDIPTPWREPVFERVYSRLNGEVQIVYFKGNEKRRLWAFEMGKHPKTILKAITVNTGGTERFFNPGLVALLLKQRPRVALVCASLKDPSAWLAMSLCRLIGTRVALIADTWLGRDRDIGVAQRSARRLAYRQFGDAFVGASRQTIAMFRHYNERIAADQCFLSHLVADDNYFDRVLAAQCATRRFDLMFSGRIVDVKNPLFFARVCAGVRARLGECRVLILGDGDESLKRRMRDIFTDHGVSFEFAGFVRHEALPGFYAQSRLLLLPTSGDCWGVVLNEAMLAGTPALTTEWTAAAGELVLHDRNGYVLPLDVDTWAAAASALLADSGKWAAFSKCAGLTAREFTYDRAAAGILDAFAYLKPKS